MAGRAGSAAEEREVAVAGRAGADDVVVTPCGAAVVAVDAGAMAEAVPAALGSAEGAAEGARASLLRPGAGAAADVETGCSETVGAGLSEGSPCCAARGDASRRRKKAVEYSLMMFALI